MSQQKFLGIPIILLEQRYDFIISQSLAVDFTFSEAVSVSKISVDGLDEPLQYLVPFRDKTAGAADNPRSPNPYPIYPVATAQW